jgi:ATP synthase protein I
MVDEEAKRSGPGDTPASRRDGGAGSADLAQRLRRLSARLQRHRRAEAPRGGAGSDPSGYARAVKIGSEFIAGIVVGAGLGWGIDQGLGTRPWGMIIFLLLGFAAGVLNVMRAEGMVGPAGIRRPEDGKDRRTGDESGPAQD